MKYAYFPGCALKSSAIEYDMSTQAVAGKLGIELLEIEDWICCGATPAHLTLHLLSLALPVKNLLKAQKEKLEVVTCCAACFNRLKVANHFMQTDEEHRVKVNTIVHANYHGDVAVKHLLEVLINDYGLENIAKAVVKKLENLKVASYYGCLLIRPPEIMKFDDPEDPHAIDDLMKVLGAEAINWPYKHECCGASFSIARTDIVLRLTNDVLRMAKEAGAEMVVVACPLCHSNLDMRQMDITQKYHKCYALPILYFTQILGLALGIEPKKLGLDKHFVDPMKLLKKKGII